MVVALLWTIHYCRQLYNILKLSRQLQLSGDVIISVTMSKVQVLTLSVVSSNRKIFFSFLWGVGLIFFATTRIYQTDLQPAFHWAMILKIGNDLAFLTPSSSVNKDRNT